MAGVIAGDVACAFGCRRRMYGGVVFSEVGPLDGGWTSRRLRKCRNCANAGG